MAAGPAASARLMSLLVQRPVDTRGSADKQENDGMIQMASSKSSTAEANVFCGLIEVSLPCMEKHVNFHFFLNWLLFNTAGFMHKAANE